MAIKIGRLVSTTRRNNSAELRPMAADVSCFVNATVIRLDVNAIAQITGVPSFKVGPDSAAYREEQGCCENQYKQFIHDYFLKICEN